MNILIILAHPNHNSFNHAIARETHDALRSAGHSVILHDLYKEGFDPVLPIEALQKNNTPGPDLTTYCTELENSGGLIFIHPNWWGQPPAILKGWIDRVFIPNVAYKFQEGDSGEGIPIGLLKGKKAIVFNTSDTPEQREKAVFGDPLESIWKKCIFGFCGIADSYRRTFGIIVTSTLDQRLAWLAEARKIACEWLK